MKLARLAQPGTLLLIDGADNAATDAALYATKRQGRAQAVVFDSAG